jgi:hypothetical protein
MVRSETENVIKKIRKGPAVHTPEWHEARRQGFGGSDMCSLLGLNHFTNPQDLYREKRGEKGPSPSGKAAERGVRMEPYVLGRMARALDIVMRNGEAFVRHPRWEGGVRVQANTDAGASGFFEWKYIHHVGEAKTTRRGARLAPTYRKGRVPLSHWVQVTMYGRCVDLDNALVGCVIGPDDDDIWTPTSGDLRIIWVKPCKEVDRALFLLEKLVVRFWRGIQEGQVPSYSRHVYADEVISLWENSSQEQVYVEG